MKEKKLRCSKAVLDAVIDLGRLLLDKGVNLVATEGDYDEERDECIIVVYIHCDDEKKNHDLPEEYMGFRLKYDYTHGSTEFA